MSSREPAPGALAQVQRFINTLDVESGADELATPQDLLNFFRGEGLVGDAARAAGDDLARTIAVREALRALLYANNGEQVDPEAVQLLNDEADRARLVVCFNAEGKASLSPCRDEADAGIGRLLAIVLASMESETWEHLKACRRHSCLWAFYDRSKNHSSKWCSMEVCGTREKAQNYRARQKQKR